MIPFHRVHRRMLLCGVAVSLAALSTVLVIQLEQFQNKDTPKFFSTDDNLPFNTGYPVPATPTITAEGSDFGAKPTGGISPSTLSDCGGSGNGKDFAQPNISLLDATGGFEEGAYINGTSVGNCGGVKFLLGPQPK